MFVVFLRFAGNKSAAAEHVHGHQEWIRSGFEDGVFLLVGSIQPGPGGAVLAYNTTLEDLEHRVSSDPFVAENIVCADVIEIAPGTADDRLSFLLA